MIANFISLYIFLFLGLISDQKIDNLSIADILIVIRYGIAILFFELAKRSILF